MSSESIHGVPIDQIAYCLELSDQYFNYNKVVPPLKRLMTGGGGSTLMPRFFCGTIGDDLYIVTRGATEAHDFLTVLNMAQEPLAGGEVHSGVLGCARYIISQCRTHIDNCKGKIIVTGHSLGGATSAMIAAVLRLEEKRETVSAITAAAFPVFTRDLKEQSKSFITAVVYNNDIVPSLTRKNLTTFIRSLGAGSPNTPPEQANAAACAMLVPMLEGILRSRGVTDEAVFAGLRDAVPRAVESLTSLPKGMKDVFCAGDVTRVVIGPNGAISLQPFTEGQPLNPIMIPMGVADHNLQLLIAALKKLANPPQPATGPQEIDDLD